MHRWKFSKFANYSELQRVKISPPDTKRPRESTGLIESFIFCRRSPLNSQNSQQESSVELGKFQKKTPNIMKIKVFRENHGFSRFWSQAAQTWYPASRSSKRVARDSKSSRSTAGSVQEPQNTRGNILEPSRIDWSTQTDSKSPRSEIKKKTDFFKKICRQSFLRAPA